MLKIIFTAVFLPIDICVLTHSNVNLPGNNESCAVTCLLITTPSSPPPPYFSLSLPLSCTHECLHRLRLSIYASSALLGITGRKANGFSKRVTCCIRCTAVVAATAGANIDLFNHFDPPPLFPLLVVRSLGCRRGARACKEPKSERGRSALAICPFGARAGN